MPILRSREIPSPPNPPSSKTLEKGFVEPSTPSKVVEFLRNQSPHKASPSTNPGESPPDSTPISGPPRRRSLRLASRSNSGESGFDYARTVRKRRRNDDFDGNESGGKSQYALVSKTENGFDSLDGARVSDSEEENAVKVSAEVAGEVIPDSEEESEVVETPVKVKEVSKKEEKESIGFRMKKGKIGSDWMNIEVKQENEYLSLRSGARVRKRTSEESNGNVLALEDKTGVKDEKGKGILIEGESESGVTRRLTREEKGKGKLTSDDLVLSNVSLDMVKLKLASEDMSFNLKTNQITDEAIIMNNSTAITTNGAENVPLQGGQPVTASSSKENAGRAKSIMEQFKDIARRNAYKYAHFNAREEEDNHVNLQAEAEVPLEQPVDNIEDWPGPFSTAMKIIKDREKNLNRRRQNSSSEKGGAPLVSWTPRKERDPEWAKRAVPSLRDFCLSILAKNVDSITSLNYVPDVLRHKLSQLLCDSRRMNVHFLNLLLDGSPSEIRLADCSWLEEDKFGKSFVDCNTSNLTVLQLDLCGHCLSDSSLLQALIPKGLSALTAISLKGACRISDVGLCALVSSTPALRSMNLSQCSLLTDVGINNVANSLGPILRELYLDDCSSLDAMSILPALKGLSGLEVLSLRGIDSASDKFVKELMSSNGQNIKVLNLACCGQLTDSSLKVIAETCSQLCVLDLAHLSKLTDIGMAYLANGCRGIHDLTLCRNAFSDEAIAAFLETSGQSLTELSLNNIVKIGQNTTISLARRCKNLHSLDLSWCRRLTDEALGLIADSCLSLRVLKVFGLTQVTRTFFDGHSNPHLRVIGLKLTPILEHIKRSDFQQGPLHYPTVTSI